MIILGIDTSCDDTGVGVVKDGEVAANVIASQTALHAPFGGVMPEQASREHLSVIDEVVRRALVEANLTLGDITAVAATYGPGLVGALLVGLNYAKALAWARELPFVPIHHLEGHIASCLGSGPSSRSVQPPFLCLIASGGHTNLFDVKAWGEVAELGHSRDDAAGEAFDKVARLLGLSYPGGPALSKLAEAGDDSSVDFTVPLRTQTGFDFSFSGLKTAVSVLLQKQPDIEAADVAASFERVAVESLVGVTLRAARATGHKKLVVAGGVAANKRLRKRFAQTDLEVYVPPLSLATDNGAMIALAAFERFRLGLAEPRFDLAKLAVDAVPYSPLATATSDDSDGVTERPKARS